MTQGIVMESISLEDLGVYLPPQENFENLNAMKRILVGFDYNYFVCYIFHIQLLHPT